jgi:addiction module RelB/DinJ family antitoxin
MSETVIRSRIDSGLKLEAQALLERFGLTMSEAIRIFLNQVVIEKGLPFQIKLPKEQALEYDRWFREQVQTALDEADKAETAVVPHDVVQKNWGSKRKALERQVGKSGR